MSRDQMINLKFGDNDYPESLRNIPDPPRQLFVLGEIPYMRKIGIVGSRKISNFGKIVTSKITLGLIKAGFVIVSGMAVGIDSVAHWTAINNGGRTIAVLGAGVDIIYPPENQELYNSILQSGGAIISEVPPGVRVSKEMFPARNRIISGLSEAVVIIEAELKSGSLITARMALEQGREVFAVPGSPGPNYLIDQGAISVSSAQDILTYSQNLT